MYPVPSLSQAEPLPRAKRNDVDSNGHMVSTIGHDQQRSICLRLRDVLYPRDAVALMQPQPRGAGVDAGAAAALSRLSSLPLSGRSCRRSRCGIRTTLGCCTPLVRKLPNHSLK